MRAWLTALISLLLIIVLTACVAKGPGWTNSPSASASPGATPAVTPVPPNGGNGGPGGQPGSDDVLPTLTPKAQLAPVPAGEVNVAYAPDVPSAAGRGEQAIVEVGFDIVEGIKTITPDGIQYETWGFRLRGDESVLTGTPGPIIRARVGDVVRFTLTNPATNKMPHNVDFHAVTGHGGGAKDLTVAPGQTAAIEARMLYPGMFMYHCAFGDVPLHISQGMYGGILVDPEQPLPPVERELYVVQSEFYTGPETDGIVTTDRQAITDEDPEYVVFNGAVGALTGDNAPSMRVGETMRIYFVNAGLNLDSNFHPIGSHWDKVWEDGGLLNPPLRGLQTTLVPAGGGTIVEFIAQVPMTVVLVDHALARAFDKGAVGQIVITGDPNPEIYEGFPVAGDAPAPAPTAVPSSAAPTDTAPSASPTTPETPAPAGSDAPTSAPGSSPMLFNISIVPGAGTYQPDGAADEYAPTEAQPDYSTNILMVPLGATVTWTNNDPGMAHTVTSTDGKFDSGMLAPGQSWSYTFNDPGDFDYLCTPHPWMKARISVMMH